MSEPISYEHTQGTNRVVTFLLFFWPLVAVGFASVLSTPAGGPVDSWRAIAIVFVPLAVLYVGVQLLTISISSTEIKLRWRLGWPNKSILRSDIASIERIRTKWYFGWGIRKVPNGWMWNIWGRDAIRLNLRSGKCFVLGTDDIDRLEQVLS